MAMMYEGSKWTPERVEMLLALNRDGLHAGEIADELGQVTRNGVISKLHRLHVPMANASGPRHRQTNEQINARRRRKRNGHDTPARVLRTPEQKPEVEQVVELPPENIENAIEFMVLGPTTCRWPIGDPRSLDTIKFCGAPINPDHPYCPGHCRMAYVKPPKPKENVPWRNWTGRAR